MPQPAQIPPQLIIEKVGRAIGRQRREIDQQFQALRDASTIFVSRMLRSADQALDAFQEECLEENQTAAEFCRVRFEEPLTEAYGEFHFARALSADAVIVRSDGQPLMRGKGTPAEHLRILLLRAVEGICGRTVPRGLHGECETANAIFLRAKAERLQALAAGLSGDPKGDVRSLYAFHSLEDAKALGATHPSLRPVEVKLQQVRDALSAAADEWSATIDEFGYRPHHLALLAHKRRSDSPLPPAYGNNPIAVACRDCAARYEAGQPFQLRTLKEASHAP